MTKSKWTGAVSSDWADPDNWSPAGAPGATSDVVIAAGGIRSLPPAPVASASIGTVNSITVRRGSKISPYLSFESAGTNTVTTFLDDAGYLQVDHNAGEGGTTLNIGGTLTNGNHLVIGNTQLSTPDEVTAAALDNAGELYLIGSATDQALLDVGGAAGFGTTGTSGGYVRLAGDSAIEFASGEITSVGEDTHLGLVGNEAFIEDSNAPGSNSALTGLASIDALGASFVLQAGASLSTTGGLVNDGRVDLDPRNDEAASGGSTLDIGGKLTNGGSLLIGNATVSAPDTVTATALDNTGEIRLIGSSADQARLDVAGSAGFGTAGVLSGNVRLMGDSAIAFASGQITSLADNAQLHLDGNDAFIEDSAAPGSNSALTGFASIDGLFDLENGASVSTAGALVNDGYVHLDLKRGEGGSSLTVGGTLTNAVELDIGNIRLSASDKVTAASLDNSGDIDLYGDGTNLAALDVSGATTNNDSISITGDTVELAGPVGGKGSFYLSSNNSGPANLQFDSSVSGQAIVESGADALILEQAQSFGATIYGFGTGDTIDAANLLFSGTHFHYAENSGGTGGTLTLHDGSLTANILMFGDYSKSSFTLAPDSGTGTLVKFV